MNPEIKNIEKEKGWFKGVLSDFGQIVSGGTPKTNIPEYWGEDIAWITPADLSGYSEKYIHKGRKSITSLGLMKSSAKLMPKGSVLFSSRAPIGYVAIAGNDLCTNQGFKSIVPNLAVNNDFLYYYLKSIKQLAEKRASGTTFKELSGKAFAELPLSIPPLPEQRAIVSKIEQLFSELDNGIANLRLAQEQLKVYRQAVLKKAFEGELTKEWREKNTNIETASKLLNLISENRKMKWENEQLAKFDKTGKKPKDDLWKLKYKETNSPDTTNLPNLPKSWCWVYPEQMASWDDVYALAIGPFGSNLKVSDYTSEGTPLVFVRNIRSGIFTNQNTKYVSKEKAQELRPHWVNPHDILITKMGEPPGEACLYPVGHPLAIITADCIKFHLCSLLDNPIYFVYAINSSVVKSQITSITMGVAQKKISLERFKTIVLPFPPLPEQQVIVEEIETRLSVCDKMAQDIDEALEKAEALRQSILKKAFEGKLLNERELAEVQMAEDWEPAEVLLERVRAEKRETERSD